MTETLIPRRPHHVSAALESIRCIFVIHKNEPGLPGSESGLGITINCTMRVLRKHGVDAQSWGITGKGHDKAYEALCHRLENEEWKSARPITHLIISSPNFIRPYEFAELAQRWPEIEFVMLAHTGLAYMCIDDHGPEKIRKLLHLERGTHNFKVAGNNQRFQWFDIYGIQPLLLPNLYDTDTFVNPVSHRHNHDPLRIGVFGENRPWKNQSVAAMAALSIARKMNVQLEMYVNGSRWEQTWPYDQARKELFDGLPWAKIVTVPWSSWSTFREIVGTMDICIHPSFDETFCVVCSDGIAEGVPSVVSNAIEWCPRSWQTAEPFDPEHVANVGMSLLHSRGAAVHAGRKALTDYVRDGVARWIAYLVKS